jgi:hypothetical protein
MLSSSTSNQKTKAVQPDHTKNQKTQCKIQKQKTTEANYRRPSGLVWWSSPQSKDSKLHCTNNLGHQTKPDQTKEIGRWFASFVFVWVLFGFYTVFLVTRAV